MKPQGLLLVLSGPSGAGKGTICQMLREKLPDLAYSVSVTTRQARNGEVDGVNYFFKSVEEVKQMIAEGELLEYAEVYGNYYGTPRSYVMELLNQGKDVILEIDIQGAMQIKKRFPDGVFVFIVPPSLDELCSRIYKRGTDSEDVIKRRLASATGELAYANEYDYIVVNLPGINKMLQSNPDVCIQKVDDQWLVAHSRLPDDRDFNISDLGYYTIPKLYGLMDTSSIDAVNATNITSQPFLNSKGQGVIVGIIDTGIDYLSENFCDTAGNTRIMAIWDQTLEYRQNLYVNYGRIYEQAEINTALEAYRNGLNPYDYVGTTDITGHGTFMAGVIASRKIDDYIGVAPEASIVCVKLKNAKKYLRDYFYIRDDAVCFEETDIMLAARFLKDYAGLKKMPLVIYMGLGSGLGSRTGGSPLSNVLDSLTMHVNTCVVVPAGNEAVKRTHFSGYASVVPEYKEMEINVERRGKGFVLEIWQKVLMYCRYQ